MKKSKREGHKSAMGGASVRRENQDGLRNQSTSDECIERSRHRDSGNVSSCGAMKSSTSRELANAADQNFVGCANRCLCSCHCSALDNCSDNATVTLTESPPSPQKLNGLFVTLRRKFSQIMKRDNHESHSSDNNRTMPRARSSDRSCNSRGTSSVLRSRTLPRKSTNTRDCSGTSTPSRPVERATESFSLHRGRSFHQQAPRTCEPESSGTISFGATLSPARLHRAVCRFRNGGWTAEASDDHVSSQKHKQSKTLVNIEDAANSGALVTVQDTGYGHTSAPVVSDDEDDLNNHTLGGVPAFYDQVRETTVLSSGWSLTRELHKLPKYGWYWGPIARSEAEERLAGQPDGAFLLRDSSDDRYLLSLSFRSDGRTLHTRIEHCNGLFSFYAQPESEGYRSIVELIERSMSDSQSGVFCYSRARTPGSPSFPVRLAKPVSRFTQVRSLQYLCRFVIRQHTRIDYIQRLPLPTSIKGWLEETQY